MSPRASLRRVLSIRPVPKPLINSDEDREWRVYHAQPRHSLRRLPDTDGGRFRAAMLKFAGLRARVSVNSKTGKYSQAIVGNAETVTELRRRRQRDTLRSKPFRKFQSPARCERLAIEMREPHHERAGQ